MSTLKDNRPVMAEALVRHILGDTTSFERICTQRGVSLAGGIAWALQAWMVKDMSPVPESARDQTLLPGSLVHLIPLMLPDPSDCPQGQEKDWLEICEHDLSLLREAQNKYAVVGDISVINRIARSIDAYLQAMSELKERVA